MAKVVDEASSRVEDLTRTVRQRTEKLALHGRERIQEEKDRLKSTVETIT
jgi:hypothetical protein